MQVRARQESDLEGLGAILQRVYEKDAYPVEGISDPVGWLSSPGLLQAWTALDSSGTLLGQVMVAGAEAEEQVTNAWKAHRARQDLEASTDDIALLARLFVDPPARGRGAGAALVDAARRWAEGQGKRLVLNVLLKDQAAIRVYDGAGWVKFGEGTHTNWKGEQFDEWFYVSPEPEKESD